MILKIADIQDNKYYLFSKDKKKYEHSFRFLNLPKNPGIGDYIDIKDVLLDKKYGEYDDLYLFGPLNKPYGRSVKDKNDTDVIMLKIDGKEFYLKRFFG